jgi:leader peptidase (prepilin peptidase)/N-methyltransferase
VIAASVLLGAALVTLSVIDLGTFRLPDAITLPLLATGLVLTWLLAWDAVWWRAAAALVGFLALAGIASVYHRVRGRHGLGLGDAKLFVAAGSWAGGEGLPSVLLWATGAAIASVLVAASLGKKTDRSSRIPFGPFLALGTWLVWTYGPLRYAY